MICEMMDEGLLINFGDSSDLSWELASLNLLLVTLFLLFGKI